MASFNTDKHTEQIQVYAKFQSKIQTHFIRRRPCPRRRAYVWPLMFIKTRHTRGSAYYKGDIFWKGTESNRQHNLHCQRPSLHLGVYLLPLGWGSKLSQGFPWNSYTRQDEGSLGKTKNKTMTHARTAHN